MKLAVARAPGHDWLTSIEYSSAGADALFLSYGEESGGSTVRSVSVPLDGAGDFESPVPSWAGILHALSSECPDACFVIPSTVFGRLVRLASDSLDIPVFSFIESEEDLDNLGRHRKTRPDLFLLGDSKLFPAALSDSRYGSTILPAGHPGRDAAAAPRFLDAIRRWSDGILDPEIPDLSVIVPAYRETENLPFVCERLLLACEAQDFVTEILLIDDASPDDTYAVALDQMWRSPRIRAFTKPTPRGMGNAIRFGIARARAPVLAITMGDGSDEVDRIPAMFHKIRDDGYSLAIGSRYRVRRNFENVPALYRFWSRCFRITTRLVVGVALKDYTNAFRAFHRRIFARYGFESGGFEISPEITFKAWFATRRVTEVDVRHLKRAAGQSNFSFLRAGPGYAKILFKAFINRLTGKWFTLDW